jgi:hypothetical protein
MPVSRFRGNCPARPSGHEFLELCSSTLPVSRLAIHELPTVRSARPVPPRGGQFDRAEQLRGVPGGGDWPAAELPRGCEILSDGGMAANSTSGSATKGDTESSRISRGHQDTTNERRIGKRTRVHRCGWCVSNGLGVPSDRILGRQFRERGQAAGGTDAAP